MSASSLGGSASELYAHSPAAAGGAWHSLTEHSKNVADMAAGFAARFGGSSVAWRLGWWHDAAKADPRFQAYLRAAQEGRPAPKCPHSIPGAVAGFGELKKLALAVAGHHGGLHDCSDWKGLAETVDQRSVTAAADFVARSRPAADTALELPNWVKSPLETEMFLRMAFSCLVDADRLDTESFRDPRAADARGGHEDISWYRDRLAAHMETFQGAVGNVNERRRAILESCLRAAGEMPGVFSLTVPTGGGKTLSGLAFALNHAVAHGKRRVIVAIPYTSIIDQTASVYEGIFGEGALLEHHSAVEGDDDREGVSQSETRRRLAAENWDCPLVVTTTVQLFESLLSHKTGRCRKLHNIVDSVLIVDEVQALPEKCLGPILDVLRELVDHYGCSVVLSTATPPDYTPVDDRLLADAREIVPDYADHFAALRRVEFEFPGEAWSLERLAEEATGVGQSLTILNSRKDAVALVRAMGEVDGLFHLSTLLCGHHRRRVLAGVRERLKDGRPVRLVSTQVVEAGVDVDFPVVLRALGPLDRIVQAAGRCNREGKRDGLGRCVVFKLEGGRTPSGAYKTGTSCTPAILEEYGQSIAEPAATRRYTRELYRLTETGATSSPGDRATVQRNRCELKFRRVGEQFRLIDQATVPLVVESYTDADVKALVGTWESSPGGWFGRLSQFTVNVYERDLDQYRSDGLVTEHESGAWIYTGPYDKLLGLAPEMTDPADLTA